MLFVFCQVPHCVWVGKLLCAGHCNQLSKKMRYQFHIYVHNLMMKLNNKCNKSNLLQTSFNLAKLMLFIFASNCPASCRTILIKFRLQNENQLPIQIRECWRLVLLGSQKIPCKAEESWKVLCTIPVKLHQDLNYYSLELL